VNSVLLLFSISVKWNLCTKICVAPSEKTPSLSSFWQWIGSCHKVHSLEVLFIIFCSCPLVLEDLCFRRENYYWLWPKLAVLLHFGHLPVQFGHGHCARLVKLGGRVHAILCAARALIDTTTATHLSGLV
jgi:hypothetical protein